VTKDWDVESIVILTPLQSFGYANDPLRKGSTIIAATGRRQSLLDPHNWNDCISAPRARKRHERATFANYAVNRMGNEARLANLAGLWGSFVRRLDAFRLFGKGLSMSHFASRWSLALIAAAAIAPLGSAQDPTPVAYWSHARPAHWGSPAVNAFTPPAHAHPFHARPQMAVAPQGQPEAGIQAPFVIPPSASHGHGHSHGHRLGQWIHNLKGHFRLPPPMLNDSLPTHPYARSPRDFFMFHENLEAERSRDLRPTIVP
jgi:hypothetical protein